MTVLTDKKSLSGPLSSGGERTCGPWVVPELDKGLLQPWSPCPRAVGCCRALSLGGGRGAPWRPVARAGWGCHSCLLQQHDWAVMLRKAADSYEKKAVVNITKCLIISFHIWNFEIIMGRLKNSKKSVNFYHLACEIRNRRQRWFWISAWI